MHMAFANVREKFLTPELETSILNQWKIKNKIDVKKI